MLNDLSRFTRLSTFLQLTGPALVIGALVGAQSFFPLGEEFGAGVLVLIGIGLLGTLGWGVWHSVTIRRMERRFWGEVVTGSEELLAGPPAAALPARVVRRRVQRTLPAFTLATGRSAAPSIALAVTVVGAGAARRVGLLAPVTPQLWPRGTPLLVTLHPGRPEVAVLEDRVTAEAVAAGAADERWAQPLPSDRGVVGGWSALVALALLGVAAGFLVGLGASFLLSL